MNPLIVLPLRTDKNRSQQAEGLVQRRRGRHTHACQHATLRATDMEHGRGTGASAITHPFAGRVPGSHGHSCAATLCWEWGPGRTQAVQRRLGWDWDSPGTQAAISRGAGGAGHTKQRARERQHHSSPSCKSLGPTPLAICTLIRGPRRMLEPTAGLGRGSPAPGTRVLWDLL